MLEVMREDYVRTARAKGLKERVVIWKHAFRNALIPIITLMALRLPWLFAGTVVLESIFVLPGMGRLIFESTVITRDYLVVQASVLMFVVFVTLANLLADILYAYVNPKIRYR
jgi:peptide/nickel transport system permease protein